MKFNVNVTVTTQRLVFVVQQTC